MPRACARADDKKLIVHTGLREPLRADRRMSDRIGTQGSVLTSTRALAPCLDWALVEARVPESSEFRTVGGLLERAGLDAGRRRPATGSGRVWVRGEVKRIGGITAYVGRTSKGACTGQVRPRALDTFALMTCLAALPNCSGEKNRQASSETEIHARELAHDQAPPGQHIFACRDGGTLLVDFKNQGLTLELRRRDNQQPLRLTAPAQGLRFMGDNATATFAGGDLQLQVAKEPERVCRRSSI